MYKLFKLLTKQQIFYIAVGIAAGSLLQFICL